MTAIDWSHMDALQSRLFREKQRLAAATTERERAFRQREIAACEREIAGEYRFLGVEPPPANLLDMSEDELMRELGL